MNNNLSAEELFEGVIVYKQAVPHAASLIKILENSKIKERSEDSFFEPWKGWYGFGDQVTFPWLPYQTLDEVINTDWNIYDSELLEDEDEERYVAKVLTSVFYTLSKDYMSRTKPFPKDWSHMGLAVCRYQKVESKELAMSYHTDYEKSKEEAPGYKFALTCVMYLNDNYDGGEILLLDTKTTQVIEYNPFAGDVVFFPSAEPYYHGVNKIFEGEKYIVRLFWGYDFPGSDEWHENEKKYGKEEWQKMHTAEVKRHFHEGTYHKEVVWDPEELNAKRFIKGERPTVTPYLSHHPIIRKGKPK